MIKLFKNMFFFEASNEVIKVMRIIVLATVSYNFIAWRLFKTFGTTFWREGNVSVQMYDLLFPVLDGGYLAFIGNLFIFWCLLLSGYLSITRFRKTLIISLTYLIIFLDDCLSIHENFNNIILSFFGLIKIEINEFLMSIVQNFGELIFWTIPLTILITWIIVATKRNISKESIKFISINIFFFGVFAFFGIVIDQLNPLLIKFGDSFQISQITFLGKCFQVIEEFGEIFSIGLAFIWMLNILGFNKLKNI